MQMNTEDSVQRIPRVE